MSLVRCSNDLVRETAAPGKGTSKMSDQPKANAATIPVAKTMPTDAAQAKKVLLQDIRVKWGKFSEQELNNLTSNDDLVTQLVAKYGLTKEVAQRDADALRNSRNI